MEDLLKKVSSYQLFNYLLSGAVLVATLDKTTSIHLSPDDAILAFFAYYFVGMVVSRIGSLVVEPVLKYLKVIKFKPHSEYVRAAALDPRIDTLSQENNTYRTLIATFLVYIITYLGSAHWSKWFLQHQTLSLLVGAVLLTVLFASAYHKQTKYVTSRINTALKNNP